MVYTLKFAVFAEFFLRTTLQGLFLLFDYIDPFIREIHNEELWLYKYPPTQSYVPSRLLYFIITVVPLTISLTDYLLFGNTKDLKKTFMALTLAYPLNGFVTCALKDVVGRPRPDFYYRCFPSGQGTDFRKCSGLKWKYMDGRKSFPSGHSSFAFTCMVFVTLYLARRLRLLNNCSGESWKICICVAPILLAACIAASRTCDYHHHYEDVIAGSLLGTSISYLVFKVYFPNQEDPMGQD